MSKQAVLAIITAAAVGGWIYSDEIMQRIHGGDAPAGETSTVSGPADSDTGGGGGRHGDSGKIYSWKDADGNTHFGSRAEMQDAQEVHLSKSNTVSLGGGKKNGDSAPPPSDSRSAYGGAHSGGKPHETLPQQANRRLNSAAAQQQAEMNAVSEGSQ